MLKRTRTGCITCRRRRLKCDEAKPTCIRCGTANFVCDGYEQPRSIIPRASSTPSSRRVSPAAVASDKASSRSPAEIPWRHTNWREDQLPVYHHFVTQTVSRLFRADHAEFWRDEVARMSFGVDVVYEALLCVSAAHRTSLLLGEDESGQEASRLNVFALRSYGKTLRLLAEEIKRHKNEDLRAILIVLLLLTYFECFMENPKGALRHLWAAIQVYRCYQHQALDVDDPKMAPIQDVILRLDFLAQKLVPYSRTSIFCEGSDLALNQTPFWNRPMTLFPSSMPVDRVKTEAHSLIRLVCGYNSISGVVWGCWSCPDLEQIQVTTMREIAALPIPPKPIICSSNEAAINIIMLNSYLGCALGLVTTTDEDPAIREVEVFKLAYQTLAICQGMLTPKNGQSASTYKPGEAIDLGVTIYLFNLFRRCFSVAWQDYTISLLRRFRREGLANGYAAANTLGIMRQVQRPVRSEAGTAYGQSSLGNIRDRLIPMLMPRGDEGLITAYYLRYGISGHDSDEAIITMVAKATWNQDIGGKLEDLKIQRCDSVGSLNLELSEHSSMLLPFRQSVKNGWHGYLSAATKIDL